jgi:hypothetical protein
VPGSGGAEDYGQLNMVADTIDIGARVARVPGRSSLSNASKLLAGIDGRTTQARRYRDILNNLVIEYALSSETDLIVARSLAVQSVWLEQETAKMAKGEPIDTVMLVRAGNAIRRLHAALERTTKARIRRAKA